MLLDQVLKVGEGVWLKFFGKLVYMMILVVWLIEIGVMILMVWGECLFDGCGYCLYFYLLWQLLVGVMVDCVQQINFEIEVLVCECLIQYFWGYNCYKQLGGVELLLVE